MSLDLVVTHLAYIETGFQAKAALELGAHKQSCSARDGTFLVSMVLMAALSMHHTLMQESLEEWSKLKAFKSRSKTALRAPRAG